MRRAPSNVAWLASIVPFALSVACATPSTDRASAGAFSRDGGACAGDACADGRAGATACARGAPGCTCGWSPPERLSTYQTSGSYSFDIAADPAGGAVALFGEDGPLSVRALDPESEVWAPETELLQNANSWRLEHAGNGALLLLADSRAAGLTWSRFDARARRFARPASVHPVGSKAQGQIVTSGSGITYVVDYPVVRRLLGDAWGPSAASDPIFHFGLSVVADDAGNLLAAWTDQTQQDSALFGTHWIPDGVSAASFDGRQGAFGAEEKVAISGGGTSPDVALVDGDQVAHVVWWSDAGLVERRRTASGTWTDPVSVPALPAFRDDAGDLRGAAFDCALVPCRLTASRFERRTGTWSGSVLTESANLDSSILTHNGGRAIFVWTDACDANGFCTLFASRFDGSGDFTAPEVAAEHATQHWQAALGPDGTAAILWSEWSGTDPGNVSIVRYARDTGWSSVHVLEDRGDNGHAAVTVDSRGFTTALWDVPLPRPCPPGSSCSAGELRASRWACRTELPTATARDGSALDPDAPAPYPSTIADGGGGRPGG